MRWCYLRLLRFIYFLTTLAICSTYCLALAFDYTSLLKLAVASSRTAFFSASVFAIYHLFMYL